MPVHFKFNIEYSIVAVINMFFPIMIRTVGKGEFRIKVFSEAVRKVCDSGPTVTVTGTGWHCQWHLHPLP